MSQISRDVTSLISLYSVTTETSLIDTDLHVQDLSKRDIPNISLYSVTTGTSLIDTDLHVPDLLRPDIPFQSILSHYRNKSYRQRSSCPRSLKTRRTNLSSLYSVTTGTILIDADHEPLISIQTDPLYLKNSATYSDIIQSSEFSYGSIHFH